VYAYVAEKLGLYGGIRDLELLTEIQDLRNAHIGLAYSFGRVTRTREEYETNAVAQCAETVPAAYKKFETKLERNNGAKYLLGDTPCAADFHVWEMLDQHELLAKKHDQPSPLAAFPKLTAYYDAFRAEPNLKAYFDSPDYALPVNDKALAYFH